MARCGSIVVTSSVQGVASRPTSAAYSSSKYALLGLVQAAALEFDPLGVRGNVVLPGTIDTALVRRQSGDGVPCRSHACLLRRRESVTTAAASSRWHRAELVPHRTVQCDPLVIDFF